MNEEIKPPLKAYIALGIVCMVWGLSWVASKEAVRDMPALQMAGIRQLCAGSLYVGFFIFKGYTWPKSRQWYPILLLSVLNFVINNGFSTWALKYISAGLGSIIGASFPIWLIVFTAIKYKTKPSNIALSGVLVGFLGICVVFYDNLAAFLNPDFLFGISLSLTAALAWTWGTIYTKEHAIHFNPYFSLGLQMLISGFVLTLICNSVGMTIPMADISLYSWLNIGFLVLVSSVVTFVAYVYILQVLPTNLVSIYAYINPIVAVAVGGIFFGEKVTFLIMVGIVITLLGVFLVNISLKKKPFFLKSFGRRI
jgi:drug/metabolite transporter (DMT)-like permease